MKRLVSAIAVATLTVALGSIGPASAASPHYGFLATNNGCSWDGYHSYSGSSATADTEKKGGNCVEVHVVLSVSTTTLQDWDATKAVASASGTLSFNYSDHNADPLGPPGYVGYRLY